jgi:hypothetical protein
MYFATGYVEKQDHNGCEVPAAEEILIWLIIIFSGLTTSVISHSIVNLSKFFNLFSFFFIPCVIHNRNIILFNVKEKFI